MVVDIVIHQHVYNRNDFNVGERHDVIIKKKEKNEKNNSIAINYILNSFRHIFVILISYVINSI